MNHFEDKMVTEERFLLEKQKSCRGGTQLTQTVLCKNTMCKCFFLDKSEIMTLMLSALKIKWETWVSRKSNTS